MGSDRQDAETGALPTAIERQLAARWVVAVALVVALLIVGYWWNGTVFHAVSSAADTYDGPLGLVETGRENFGSPRLSCMVWCSDTRSSTLTFSTRLSGNEACEALRASLATWSGGVVWGSDQDPGPANWCELAVTDPPNSPEIDSAFVLVKREKIGLGFQQDAKAEGGVDRVTVTFSKDTAMTIWGD